MIVYRTPGRSLTRPPRTSTIECSWRLWPSPVMYAVTSTWLVSLTRATFRSAEFGFFGVVVYTRVHTPRRCGLPLSAAVFTLVILSRRPLRTSCWMVGMYRLSLFAFVFGVLKVSVLRFGSARSPRGRACRMHPPRSRPWHRGHANWPGVRACITTSALTAEHEPPRYQGRCHRNKPVRRALSAGQDRSSGARVATGNLDRVTHRCCIPADSRN